MKQETQNTKDSTNNSLSKMGDLQKISNAKNMVELKEAVNNTLVLLQNLVDDNYLPRFKRATNDLLKNPQNQQSKDVFYEEVENALKRYGVKNGKVLKATVHSFDKVYVDEVKRSLVDEYKAISLSELMVIDIAINAYFRSLRSADVYSILIQNKEGVINYGDQTKINMIKEVGKQIQLANNQFLTAITFLKELHQPPVKVRINSKETYIAQNQQINKPELSTNP